MTVETIDRIMTFPAVPTKEDTVGRQEKEAYPEVLLSDAQKAFAALNRAEPELIWRDEDHPEMFPPYGVHVPKVNRHPSGFRNWYSE